jgi:hypothetical protein
MVNGYKCELKFDFLFQCVYRTCTVFLTRPISIQHTYINNILYTVNTLTCFDAPALFSGSRIPLL